MLRLWKPKIIDNSLVWLSHKEKFKKWSWQFDYTAVTNHWQFSCMAVCLKISLTTLLHSFENRWQWSYTALISLTNVLYGCHKSLTNVQNGHEPQSWQNYYIIIDKITVTLMDQLPWNIQLLVIIGKKFEDVISLQKLWPFLIYQGLN